MAETERSSPARSCGEREDRIVNSRYAILCWNCGGCRSRRFANVQWKGGREEGHTKKIRIGEFKELTITKTPVSKDYEAAGSKETEQRGQIDQIG